MSAFLNNRDVGFARTRDWASSDDAFGRRHRLDFDGRSHAARRRDHH